MGRAIVREPAAFLFDEPLSNLDAKLRVQMRLEIKRLQQRLGTTSIYVTHDQVEAMTLGDKLVVMRDGIRSEEHTSELQSLMRISYAVFCLKKKKKTISTHQHIRQNHN